MASGKEHYIPIIIPCYNEARRFQREAFSTFLQQNSTFAFILVNDGSKDQTLEVLRQLEKQHPRQVQIIDKPKNEGKGEAIRSGYNQCRFPYQYIGYLDADLSTPLEELHRLLYYIEEVPNRIAVFGSRLLLLGHDIRRQWWRFFCGRVFMTLMNTLLHFKVYDSQCGAKLLTKTTADITLKDPFLTAWLFDIEMLCRLKNHFDLNTVRRNILEMPLRTWHDDGYSRIRFTEFLQFPFELLKIWRHYS